MKSDIEIAQEAKMKPIAEIAASLGIADEAVTSEKLDPDVPGDISERDDYQSERLQQRST